MNVRLSTIPQICTVEEKSMHNGEEYVRIMIHSSSIPSMRAKYQIEDSLAPRIEQIKAKKRMELLGKKMIHLTTCIFLAEAREKPWSTALKASLVLFSIAAFHPVFVGSIACMNTYRLQNWNDLYSSDLNTATLASQSFSNLGQGVSYLIQGTHTLIFTSCLLMGNSYDLARCRITLEIYNELTNTLVSGEERDFINEMKKGEFSTRNNLNNIETIDTEEVNLIEIRNQIDEEKKQQLAFRNIVYLTAREFIQETKKQPWTTACNLSLVCLAITALHPFILGL